MFGPKLTTVFKSRWNALIWGGFVLMTAYCTVPSKDESDPVVDAAVSLAAKHGGTQQADHHANPWAKDPS